jgi:hypothetical protein
MIRFAIILSILVGSNDIYARIGETMDQCELRYGKPVNIISKDVCEYKKGVFGVRVEFVDNIASIIHITKNSSKNPETPDAILPTEMEVIKNSNSNNKSWVDDMNTPVVKNAAKSGMTIIGWKTEDGKLSSLYCIEAKTLSIIDNGKFPQIVNKE